MTHKTKNITLVKHLEYFNGEEWKPIIWYSNRNDNEFEQLFEGPDLIEHSEVFYNSFNEFSKIIENTDIENRGLPDDISAYIKEKIQNNPGSFYGASYYYMDELKELIQHEEEVLFTELKNGVEIKLFDNNDNIKKLLLGSGISFTEDKKEEGKKTINILKTVAKTVEQLNYIANIVTKVVYDIHGFIEDDKIRVVYYYKA